jgi:nicotinate-nucleotide adenylyltransferase
MALRRVAIYGGTFDPVHNGHLEVARRVLELFELDDVVFVPACVPPHKRNANITSAFHRFAMLALATETDQSLQVSTIELDSPGEPYAVETVERIRRTLGDQTELFFLMGADSWLEITSWHEWQRLLRMCHFIVVTRPGFEIEGVDYSNMSIPVLNVLGDDCRDWPNMKSEMKSPHVLLSNAANVDVSATIIRAAARVHDLDKLKSMVPPAVANYIEKYNLYRN